MSSKKRGLSANKTRGKSSKKGTNDKYLYTLYKSTNSAKKWDVWVEDPNKENKIKRVSFGASGYEDYTQHKDKERRERYRIRHRKDHINDITAAGSWSWWVLWGDTSNRNKALEIFLKKHHVKPKRIPDTKVQIKK